MTEADVGRRRVPADLAPEGPQPELDALVGRTLTVALPRGSIVPADAVYDPARTAPPGTAVIAVTLVPVAAGLVRAGDRIDLLRTSPANESDSAVLASGVRVIVLPSGTGRDGLLDRANSTAVVALVEVPLAAAPRVVAVSATEPLSFAFR